MDHSRFDVGTRIESAISRRGLWWLVVMLCLSLGGDASLLLCNVLSSEPVWAVSFAAPTLVIAIVLAVRQPSDRERPRFVDVALIHVGILALWWLFDGIPAFLGSIPDSVVSSATLAVRVALLSLNVCFLLQVGGCAASFPWRAIHLFVWYCCNTGILWLGVLGNTVASAICAVTLVSMVRSRLFVETIGGVRRSKAIVIAFATLWYLAIPPHPLAWGWYLRMSLAEQMPNALSWFGHGNAVRAGLGEAARAAKVTTRLLPDGYRVQIDATEVSVANYARCVRSGACSADGSSSWFFLGEVYRYGPECNWGKVGRGDYPMNCVNWFQAAAYCHWVGMRLPREQEWLGALLAPSEHDCPAGRQFDCAAASVATVGYRDHGHSGTSPVGSRPSRDARDGAFDLLGNVAEFLDDTSIGDDGTHDRLYIGGSYLRWGPDLESRVIDPLWRSGDLGFRCARRIEECSAPDAEDP